MSEAALLFLRLVLPGCKQSADQLDISLNAKDHQSYSSIHLSWAAAEWRKPPAHLAVKIGSSSTTNTSHCFPLFIPVFAAASKSSSGSARVDWTFCGRPKGRDLVACRPKTGIRWLTRSLFGDGCCLRFAFGYCACFLRCCRFGSSTFGSTRNSYQFGCPASTRRRVKTAWKPAAAGRAARCRCSEA